MKLDLGGVTIIFVYIICKLTQLQFMDPFTLFCAVRRAVIPPERYQNELSKTLKIFNPPYWSTVNDKMTDVYLS